MSAACIKFGLMLAILIVVVMLGDGAARITFWRSTNHWGRLLHHLKISARCRRSRGCRRTRPSI